MAEYFSTSEMFGLGSLVEWRLVEGEDVARLGQVVSQRVYWRGSLGFALKIGVGGGMVILANLRDCCPVNRPFCSNSSRAGT